MTPDASDRMLDLLTAEATEALSVAETRELADLLALHPDTDPDGLALAAAAADLALSGRPDPLPPALAARLAGGAAEFFAASPPPAPRTPRVPAAAWAGWVVAAGLAGVLAWTQWPVEWPTPDRQFAEIAARSGTRSFAGEKGDTAGELRWNDGDQEGYLQVRGLPALDAAKEQYQLWIVDPDRKQPVDGGVFDVKPDGTATVPVRAALRVRGAAAFAVTKESAGGVVVSDGPHLLVLAPPKA